MDVMIVDDEPLALDNVADMIPWESYGFRLVARTTDSRKAMELFRRWRPQIVITDISMPFLDGLKLGRMIRSIEPRTQLLFLTAYRDFEYARQALEIKASRYVLKHEISQNRLLDALIVMKESFEAENQQWHQSRKQLLTDLLMGVMQPAEWANNPVYRELSKQLEATLALVYMEISPYYTLEGKRIQNGVMKPEEYHHLTAAYLTDHDSILQQIGSVRTDEGGTLLLMRFSPGSSFLHAWNELQQLLRHLHSSIKRLKQWETKVSVISGVRQEELQDAFRRMIDGFDRRCLFGNEIVTPMDQKPGKAGNLSELSAEIKRVTDLLSRGDEGETISGLRTVWERIVNTRDDRAFLLLLREVGHVLVRHFQSDVSAALGVSAEEILQSLENRIRESVRRDHAYSRLVAGAIEYVKEHYADPDLTLEAIAEHLSISNVHLRATFKKETGRTMLDFITEHRIERAKAMLRDGGYKIYEVSEKVGYRTSQYFSQVFKKATGIHPKDYP
ncbi:response regulator [Paenibacillus sp. sptzw28]|uniref:response regulator transcription factor n=1 Tax=Paenibacillus sp. sptzw28 TaxID=715179 RepID=UPI001C6E0AEA|nr:response regulator [Paenibacillus sp. sptzw28]QYR23054.1 response regulator [Paenibacillus sp. sptzw28]